MHRPCEERRPPHPGAVFLERCLRPLGITQKEAAERLGISYPRMNEIVNGKRSVTPETALRLARFTDTEPEFWLDLQQAVDLWAARHAENARDVQTIEPAVGRSDRAMRRDASRKARSSTGRATRYGIARVFELGAEPPDDLREESSAAERLAIVEALTEQSWRLAAAAASPDARERATPRAGERGERVPGAGAEDA